MNQSYGYGSPVCEASDTVNAPANPWMRVETPVVADLPQPACHVCGLPDDLEVVSLGWALTYVHLDCHRV